MREGRAPFGLVPRVIYAIPSGTKAGWHLRLWPGSLADFRARIGGSAEACRGHRVISRGEVPAAYLPYFVADQAHRAGWQRHWARDLWFPPDEAFPALPGKPVPELINITLIEIQHGLIRWSILADGKCLELSFDEVDDPLILFVRFLRELSNGGMPHAPFSNQGKAYFFVQPVPLPSLCRFHVALRGPAGLETLDIVTCRQSLLKQFRAMAVTIAEHPFLADHFLERGLLPRWRAALRDRDICSAVGGAMPARIEAYRRMLCRLEISGASSLRQ